MQTAPETTLRVANSEQVTLSLNVDAPLLRVSLEPRFGEARGITLTDGAFVFPYYDDPDMVKVTWYGENGEKFKTYVEVVSRHYFDLDDLRLYGDNMDDFDELPEGVLYMARQAATEVVEQAAHRSWVHRIGRTKDFGHLFWLADNDVYQLLTEGYQLVSDCQVKPDGTAHVPFPVWVEYLYGMETIPAQVSRATLQLAAYMLRPSNRPLGATGESTDAGYIHFTTAGRDGATDIPEVNAAIIQFGRGERVLW